MAVRSCSWRASCRPALRPPALARRVARDRRISGFAQADNLFTREDIVRDLAPFDAADDRLAEQPLKVASGERRAVGGDGFENFLGVARIDRFAPRAADNA